LRTYVNQTGAIVDCPESGPQTGSKVWDSKYTFGGQDFCFYYMLETNISGHNKLRGAGLHWVCLITGQSVYGFVTFDLLLF